MDSDGKTPSQATPQVSWLRRQPGELRRRFGALGFGIRLFLVLFVTLALVGAVAFVAISDHLESYEIDSYARNQRADAAGFEDLARKHPPRVALGEIDQVLDAIGRRPGTLEAVLVAPNGAVRASADLGLRPRTDSDPRIEAALTSGVSYSGHEDDPSLDSSDFEFVTPVRFPTGVYALDTSYDSTHFDAHVATVRRTLLLVILLALVAIAGLFYLLGGRTLLRHHRLALQRATRDGLTDLSNHRAFDAELRQAIAAAARHRDPLALALLDLDHFKLINDRYGHPQGDELLRRVAAILRDGRSADRAYRIGGDEFALLLPNTDQQGAQVLIHRLSRTLSEADASASIGVAQLRPGLSAEELRAGADAALYEAKRRGGEGFVAYEEIRDRVAITTSAKREAVRRLVEEQRFATVLQPIWNLTSGQLLGLEALSRPDSSYELSGPSEAFDIAEQIGCVAELDEICVTQALRSASELPEEALLFVNLAPKTLELDSGGVDWLGREVERVGLTPGRVVVEVTERLGARTVPVLESLERLRGQGFKLALDDVGTGNAGLEMLRKIGAEYVKIDRSIVAAAATEPNARAVLMAMATFARQSGAFVIADGIEDEETLEFLRGVEALDASPGTIIQGGQGFELKGPSTRISGEMSDALPVLETFG